MQKLCILVVGCFFCKGGGYWQGDPVNTAVSTVIDRITLSITVETAVLTGHPVNTALTDTADRVTLSICNSDHLCIIDRVTLSTVHQDMLLTGWITTNKEVRNATNQSLSYIGFTPSAVDVIVVLTGWPCQQWVLMSYRQGHPVSSDFWCIIDRVILSAVGVDVLLTGWPCQQWVFMS